MIVRVALASALLATTAAAQPMDPAMPGMSMPMPSTRAAKPKRKAARKPGAPAQAAAMSMDDMPGMSMPVSSDKAASRGRQLSGTDLSAGAMPPPAPPTDHYADLTFDPAAMASARAGMNQENGGQTFSRVMMNLAELQVGSGRPGYRWDGEAWFGSDIDRLVVKSEGRGTTARGVGEAEVQALYSRAIGPYFDIQGGVRQDIRPSPARTYATVGFEGLTPYWFQIGGALFLSNKGDLLGRLEGYYDQNITQRLILQPRVELNFAAQNVRETQIGAGLSDAELGLRLRYEVTREVAPYVGVSWDSKVGRTATFTRLVGEKASAVTFVCGIRAWF